MNLQSKNLSLVRISRIGALCIVGLGSALSYVKGATTLISDTLTSATPTNLSGTTPTGADTPQSIYTTSAGTFIRGLTGTGESSGGIGIAGIQIPTIVTDSGIYSLSITETGAVGGFSLLGFDSQTSTAGEYVNSPTGPIEYVNGAGVTIGSPAKDYNTPFASAPVTESVNGEMGPNRIELVLNTDSTDWTLEEFVNGIALTDSNGAPAVYTYGTPGNLPDPTINQIVFADGGGSPNAVYSNLLLTNTPYVASVPEPSTWAYVALGAGALAFQLRRRNSV